jgi:hypothetical protein
MCWVHRSERTNHSISLVNYERKHVLERRSSEFDGYFYSYPAEPALAARQSLPPVSVRVALASSVSYPPTPRAYFSRRKSVSAQLSASIPSMIDD